jgi:hypothetical protein
MRDITENFFDLVKNSTGRECTHSVPVFMESTEFARSAAAAINTMFYGQVVYTGTHGLPPKRFILFTLGGKVVFVIDTQKDQFANFQNNFDVLFDKVFLADTLALDGQILYSASEVDVVNLPSWRYLYPTNYAPGDSISITFTQANDDGIQPVVVTSLVPVNGISTFTTLSGRVKMAPISSLGARYIETPSGAKWISSVAGDDVLPSFTNIGGSPLIVAMYGKVMPFALDPANASDVSLMGARLSHRGNTLSLPVAPGTFMQWYDTGGYALRLSRPCEVHISYRNSSGVELFGSDTATDGEGWVALPVLPRVGYHAIVDNVLVTVTRYLDIPVRFPFQLQSTRGALTVNVNGTTYNLTVGSLTALVRTSNPAVLSLVGNTLPWELEFYKNGQFVSAIREIPIGNIVNLPSLTDFDLCQIRGYE